MAGPALLSAADERALAALLTRDATAEAPEELIGAGRWVRIDRWTASVPAWERR